MVDLASCYIRSDENKTENRTRYVVTNEIVSSVPNDATYTKMFNIVIGDNTTQQTL
jgi:hypothetical protein